jgi:LysR family transcriptional regulator, transcriptional activator for bauABCD operon
MKSLGVFQEEVGSIGDLAQTTLRVAFLDSFILLENMHFSDGLRAFSGSNPNVNMELYVYHPDEIAKCVLDGDLDIAVSSVHEESSDFDCRPVFTYNSYLYCGARNKLFDIDDKKITENDLRNTSYSSKWFNNAPTLLGQRSTVAKVETFHIEATAHMILSGYYVGFLPEYYARQWVERDLMRVVRPDLYQLPYTYGFIYRRGRQLSEPAKRFIACLTDAIEDGAP